MTPRPKTEVRITFDGTKKRDWAVSGTELGTLLTYHVLGTVLLERLAEAHAARNIPSIQDAMKDCVYWYLEP